MFLAEGNAVRDARHRSRTLPALAALLIVALLLLAGCERVSQDAPAADAPAARLVVSADFGATPLLERRVPPDQSVLRALRGTTEVETAYGGGFVAGMLDRETDAAGRMDWFFWVDGRMSPVGADDVTLRAGQETWWDFHSWAAIYEPRVVVGQWPLPFAPGPVSADPPLADPLAAAGADVVPGSAPLRVRVGESGAIARREPAWAAALAEPAAAGLTAWIRDGAVVMLSPADREEVVPGARALAAAVPLEADGALMVVAGLDEASAEAAARTIAERPEVLRLRLAVAFDGTGTPLRASGREGA